MHQGIVLFLSVAITLATLLIFKARDHAFSYFIKGAVILFCAVGFFRFMLSDSFTFVINGGYYDLIFYDATDPLQTFLRWGYYLNYAVLPMAIFYKSRLFMNIASYVCLPFSVLSAVFFDDFMPYFLSDAGRGLHFSAGFRYFYFALELVLAISVALIFIIRERHVFNVKSKREWRDFLISTPLIIILMIPVYAPQSLFGYSSMIASQGSDYHTGWLAILLIAILGLYYVFRFKPYRERRMLIIFLSIVLFFNYDSLYLMGFSIPRLPIQLCNLASYFYMIAFIFNMPRFFQFCFITNTTGAIIALLMPDFLPGAFGFWNMHFVLEHSLALMIPALAMGLRLYKRPDKKSLKYTFIGFSCYFVFCFITGLILNGYSDVTGFEVNYFFLFDLDKAINSFPFIEFMEEFGISFGRFSFNPLFVTLVYIFFLLACVGFYYAVRYLEKMEDDHFELRRSAIELYERKTGKTARVPKELPND